MAFIIYLVIGLVAGLLAIYSLPGKDPGGGIIPVMFAIAGAIGGGFIGRSIAPGSVGDLGGEAHAGLSQPGFVAGIIGSLIGAAIVMIVYRIVIAKTARTAD